MFFFARKFFVASVFMVPAVIGLTVFSAGASSGGRSTGGAPLLHSSSNTNLQGSGHSVVFDPTKLTGDVVSQAHCTSSDNTFTITNDTPKAQKVTQGGKVVATVPDERFVYLCVSVAGTAKFGLVSDPAAKLKVTVVAGT